MKVALVSCDDLPGWEVDDNPLIEALQERGATVHRPSWTQDIEWDTFDISVIRTTWDYHSRKVEFVDWCKTVPRLFNNAEIVVWNTHKSYLRELEERGTAIAPTTWIGTNRTIDVQKELNLFGSSQGFIKPQVGACASDTLRFSCDEVEEAQQFLRDNAHQDMMLQPYLKNVETEGELTAVFIDGHFTHGVQKIPVKGDYRVQDDFGATDKPYEFTSDELQTMQETLLAVPQHEQLLYARFDYLRSDEGELLLNELELIEPSLFFRHCENSAIRLAEAILKRV
jgi:hypothetical protein